MNTLIFKKVSRQQQKHAKIPSMHYFLSVTAEFPPKICLESDSGAAGACVLFSNVTSHIDIAGENHKIHLSGCMELALTLFNKTLSDFPVSCFKIPGDEKEHEDKANNFGNFMP